MSYEISLYVTDLCHFFNVKIVGTCITKNQV